MMHEPYLPFCTISLRQNIAALVHRLMTILILRAPERVWISIPRWERCCRPYTLGRNLEFHWLPIPSGIPVSATPSDVQAVRSRYSGSGDLLIGHFGTYGSSITILLEPILLALADEPSPSTVLLMGIRSEEFRQTLIEKNARLEGLIHATGRLSAEDLSRHVAACDLLIQPFPDGVSSRRTSVMTGLSHGKPIVTTTGALSEPFWRHSDAIASVPASDTAGFLDQMRSLRTDAVERARMGKAATKLYQERFDITHTITGLRQAAQIL